MKILGRNLCGVVSLILASGAASAQEALPTIDIGAAPSGARARAPAGGGEDPRTYHPETATTATKTSTPIMETPAAIQVVPRQVLQDQQAANITRALANVSGVRSYNDESPLGGGEVFQIRGFETGNVYYDGLRMLSGNGASGRAPLINVERVEVLKGPASILYGRADPGGIVSIITKKPLATPKYAVEQLFGSYDYYYTTLDATGPLTADETLLYRLTAQVEHSHSFRDFDFTRNYFVSPVIQWNPDASTQLIVRMQFDHNVYPANSGVFGFGRYDPLSRIFGEGPAAFLPRRLNLAEPNSNTQIDHLMFGYELSHKLDADWTVTHRFGANLDDMHGRFVNSLGFDPVVPTQIDRYAVHQEATSYIYSTNLDITGKFDTFGVGHTLLVGGDYMHEQSPARYHFNFSIPPYDFGFPVHGFTPTRPELFDPMSVAYGDSETSWWGAFVQDQLELPYDLFLLAGARYDRSTVVTGYYDAFTPYSRTLADNGQRVTPRVGLLWRPLPEVSLYGSYLENYGQPGFTSGPEKKVLQAQTARQWEIGVKTELFEKRLAATVSLYELTKQHVPQPDPDPVRAALGYQVPVGETRNRGVEFDIAGEIAPGLKLIGNYAYIDSVISKDSAREVTDPLGNVVGANGFVGYRPANVARHAGGLWATYEFQDGDLKGLKFGAGANARSKSDVDLFASLHTPGFAIVSLMGSYEWFVDRTKFIAQLNVDNLLDTRYYPIAYGPLNVNIGPPRWLKGSIRMEF